jgi:subtilisin family serine protease
MDEVVAILPNLKLELIDPKETKFEGANNDERRDGMTWGLKELNIVEIWNRGYSGKGVKVAVLDTGVFGSHPILKGRVEEFVVVDPIGNRCALTDGQSFDADRHGTHVCGTIAGGKTGEDVSVGIAPDATLLVAAVLVGRTTLWTLMQGIDWAVSRGARVINLSLGLRSYEPKLSELCKLLVDDYNVIPVAAIGNEGHGNTSSPGNAPGALSVGAVDKGYRGRLSIPFFSSGASLVVDEQVSAGSQSIVNKPDIVAPGVGVLSCIPPEDRYDGRYDWAAMNGTSMAAPHVSGVAALLAQAVPKANAAAIIDVLKESADYTRGGIRPDNRWGMGVIRPVKALELLEERCRSAGKNQRKVK